jgi:hypothetical protein
MGRTFVSAGPDSVEIMFGADSLNDGDIDVGPGGAIPLDIEVTFQVTVFNAAGAKAQLLRNGHPVLTHNVGSRTFSFAFPEITDAEGVYRVRVIGQPDNLNKGYGPVETLALSAPIYAADIGAELLATGPIDPSRTWVKVESEYVPDDPRVPSW